MFVGNLFPPQLQKWFSPQTDHKFCHHHLMIWSFSCFPNEISGDEGFPQELQDLKSVVQLETHRAEFEHSENSKYHMTDITIATENCQ